LAGASNTTLYLGVGVTSVVAAVGIVYAAPFLASGAQAAGAWAASSVAAGAQATGAATVGAYLGKQAALSAVQTGVETAAAWGLGGDVSVGGVLGSFALNFGVNSLTGGTGVFARHGIEIGAGTAYDVARGENFGSSLAFNAAGVVGGEGLARGFGAAFSAGQSALAARRLAHANSQLNILDNTSNVLRNAPVCFVAGTAVMVGEDGSLLDENATSLAQADAARNDLLLPAAAFSVGLAGWWVGERRGAKRRRKKGVKDSRALAFEEWN
jgi:hypothetical protein